MAITIYSQPDTVTPSRSNVVFRVVTDSTNITTSIIARLYYRRNIDEFFLLESIKHQSAKQAGYNYHQFNFSGVLDQLLTEDYQTGSTALVTGCENSSIEFFVKFTEYYAGAAHAEHFSGYFFANNTGILKTETQGTFTGSEWYMDGTAAHKFLTNSPLIQPIRASERIQLGLLTSFSDPVIKVRETKNNGSQATVSHTVSASTPYSHRLWDYTVDEDEVVTAVIPATPSSGSPYISGLTVTSFMKYMPDSVNKMWGGVRLVANAPDILEITFQITIGSGYTSSFPCRTTSSTANFEVEYFHTGIWNLSAGSPFTATTSFATTSETVPSGSTKMRIKKTSGAGEIYIPYITLNWAENNIVNKRAQFTLDTTHIDLDTNKLEIWAEDGSSNVMSEVKTYTVDTSLVDATSRFAFKNLRGDFDHFTFKQGHKESLEVEKVRIQTELPIGFTTSDRERGVAFVNSDIIFTSYTEYETNENLTWLKELIETKEAFLVVSDVLYAVNVLTSTLAYSHHTDSQQFEITWQFSSKRNV